MLAKLKGSYSKIDLEDKRNELNKEILSLLMLTGTQSNLYNYVKNSNINEEQFLTETYMQVIELRRNLLSTFKK